MTIGGNFECFQYFNFEINFLENENLFQKTVVPFFRWMHQQNISNKTAYKNAISNANVKTKKMVISKWTYCKEWSFASNYFIFLKILFQFKNLLKRVDLLYQQPKRPYLYFCKRWSFIWRCFFRVSIFNFHKMSTKWNAQGDWIQVLVL